MTASLRFRLGAGLAIGVVLLWSAATLAAYLVVRHELGEIEDRALAQVAASALTLAGGVTTRRLEPPGPDARVTAPAAAAAPVLDDATGALRVTVTNAAGAVVLEGGSARTDTTPIHVEDGFRVDGTNRRYGAHDTSTGLSVEVVDPLSYRREALGESMLALVAPLPLLVPASIALVWLLVRAALGSVDALRRRIEERDGGDLSPLPDENLPTELKPIAESINGLLARLARVLAAEREFAANSAHELRTPVAGALAGTQRLVAELPPGALRDRALQIESSLRGLARVSEKLMQLARADSGTLVHGVREDRHETLAHVIDEPRAGGQRDRLRYAVSGPMRFRTTMDPDGLAILVRNLLENALKHSPVGSTVDVRLDGANDTLVVANDCDAVPADRLAESRRRFVRGRSTADGAGLGLSIVDAMSRGSDVEVLIASPVPGEARGIEVRVVAGRTVPDGG